MNKIFSLIVLMLFSALLPSEILELKLNKVYEIGHDKVIFSSIVGIAEDQQGNIYVLDRKLHKVFKFSSNGQFINEFCQKGKGPGDIYRPQHIAISEGNELIVTDSYSVSYLDLNGKCLEKVNVSQEGIIGGKIYSGGNHILGRKLISRTIAPPLILVSLMPEVKVINENVMTCSSQKLYKEAGVFHESISPDMWYDYSNGRSVVALSERYEIKIIDAKGAIEKTIKKNIKNPPLKKREREFLIETLINQWANIDQSKKNGLKNTIPKEKNLITGLVLSKNMIFVRRIKKDITDSSEPEIIDLFSINGDFLGVIHLQSFPIFATDKHLYFKKEAKDGDIIISKYSYILKLQN